MQLSHTTHPQITLAKTKKYIKQKHAQKNIKM